ncbi:hypothetical protein AB0R12_23740, partial [Streptomyces niveus]
SCCAARSPTPASCPSCRRRRRATIPCRSPANITLSDTYTDELTNVELGGKDPERAWQDARNRIERLLRRQGVLS